MKHFLSFFVILALAHGVTVSASAQTRGLAGGALVLDDGAGHSITLLTPPGLTCSPTYYLPALGCGTQTIGVVPEGTAEGQLLYWSTVNGGGWTTLDVGLANQVLSSNGTDPGWQYGVTGDGTPGNIPIWNGSTTLGNSSLTDDGTTVSTGEQVNINGHTFVDPGGNADEFDLTSEFNAFDVKFNTDNIPAGGGQFNVFLDGNGTAAMAVTNAAVTIGSLSTNGVVHATGGNGTLASSPIVNSDITPGTIQNGSLQNSSVTINTGSGLSGGGTVALGNSLTLANTGVLSVSGTTNQITSSGGQNPAIGISATYPGQTSITTLGTIGTGTWQGTPVANTYIANPNVTVTAGTGLSGGGLVNLGGSTTLNNTGVLSVSGTTNQITSSGGQNPAIGISATYPGQTSITTLGTIGTGTWQGTAVGVAYGGTGLSSLPQYALLVGNNTSAVSSVADVAVGRVLVSGGVAANPTYSATPTLGVAGTTTGTLSLANATGANATTIQAGASAPAATYILPTALPGAANDVLQANGTTSPVQLSWVAPSGGGSYAYLQSAASYTMSANITTTGEMAGASHTGTNFTFTPAVTGRCIVTFTGSMYLVNSGGNNGVTAQLHYGQAANGPAQAAAASGTAVGAPVEVAVYTAGHDEQAPFSCTAYVTGLTVGDPYWFDVDLGLDGASGVRLYNAQVTVTELP
jgi:hypothetical protein